MVQNLKRKYRGWSTEIQAVFFLILSCFLFAASNIPVREVTQTVDPYAIVFYRTFCCILVLLPFILLSSKEKFTLNRPNSFNLVAGIASFASLPLWFIAFKNMNIPELVSITLITPIFTALLAVIFLKDKFSRSKKIGLIMGFIGAYIIICPDINSFNKYSLFVLAACFLWSASYVATKNLTSSQDPISITFYLNLVICPLSIPYLVMYGKALTMVEISWFVLMAVILVMGNLCLAAAYKRADMSALLPYDYTRLIFASTLAFIIYDEVIAVSTIIGSAIILISSVVVTSKSIGKKVGNKELAKAKS